MIICRRSKAVKNAQRAKRDCFLRPIHIMTTHCGHSAPAPRGWDGADGRRADEHRKATGQDMMRLWRCLTALVLALLLTLSVGAANGGLFRRAGKPLGGAEHPALRADRTAAGSRRRQVRPRTDDDPRGLRHSALPSDGLGARHAGEGQLYGQSGYGEVVLQRY